MSERFWDVVCAGFPIWAVLFGLNIVLLVFMGLSLFLATPESGTRQIVVINLVLIVGFLTVLGFTIRTCRQGDY
ncbi:hypothetical protein [Natrononativus amylolyticus]|uniref:hypothetical protein n=1 Tax=Natrononativus amylolyticus TaxID=2963434 RepID=UPI0020CE4BD1|nr:hypothetical protein [Natrononativus amylolyticus]